MVPVEGYMGIVIGNSQEVVIVLEGSRACRRLELELVRAQCSE